MTRVVLADPQAVMLDGLRLFVERSEGVSVVGCFPDGTGAERTTLIKRGHPGMHVVILTGSHADADLLLALEAGADGFLYKEDSAESVVRAVREVMLGNMYISPLAARRMRDPALDEDEDALSPRELDVLVALHDELSTDEIGRKLCVSASTVKTHISAIYRKLDAHNRVAASREAERRGLVPPD